MTLDIAKDSTLQNSQIAIEQAMEVDTTVDDSTRVVFDANSPDTPLDNAVDGLYKIAFLGDDWDGYESPNLSLREGQMVDLISAVDELHKIALLGDDWDGYGSPKLSLDLYEMALEFLQLYHISYSLKLPHIAPVSGGGVGFSWSNDSKELHVEMSVLGEIGYLRTKGDEMNEGVLNLLQSSEIFDLFKWLTI